MSLFAISDLHLSLSADKSMEVFKGWENYVEKLYKYWNAVVDEGDTVIIGGDVSWAMRLSEIDADFSFINNELNGEKIILKGNHDLWWDTLTKMQRCFDEKGFDKIKILHNNCRVCGDIAACGTRGWFYDAGDADKKVVLREAGRLKMSIDAAKKTGLEPVVFLHYPPVYAGEECDEIMEVLKSERIKRCYYGHIHGAAAHRAVYGDYCGVDFKLMSCDANCFTPLLVERY